MNQAGLPRRDGRVDKETTLKTFISCQEPHTSVYAHTDPVSLPTVVLFLSSNSKVRPDTMYWSISEIQQEKRSTWISTMAG